MRSPLALLMWLRVRGWFRRMKRSAGTTRGKVFLIIGAAMIVLWLLPMAGNLVVHRKTDPERVRDLAPLIMLGVTLMMSFLSASRAVAFSPAEVDFLFPAPFTRRRLLLYKISFSALGALVLALLLSIWQSQNASMWVGAFLGMLFMLVFAQATAIVVTMLRQAALDPRSSAATRAGLVIIVVAVLAGVVELGGPMVRDGVLWSREALGYVRESVFARAVLAPFDVLTMVFTAERFWPDLVVWTAASAGMVVLVVLIALRLDEYFMETSLAASRKAQAAMTELRSGGMMMRGSGKSARWRVGMLPRWGGAGTIAWRQLTNVVRNFRGMMVFFGILAVAIGPAVYGLTQASEGGEGSVARAVVGVAGVWFLFVLPAMLRFDFRSEVDQMDVLKSLPIGPTAVTVGEILAPTMVLTVLVGLLLGMWAVLVESMRGPTLAVLPFLVPVNLMVMAIENMMFLMMPTRMASATPGDMQKIGREMVVMFGKLGLLGAGLGASAAAAGLAYGLGRLVFAPSGSLVVAGVAAWCVLAAGAYVVIRLAARLYGRFDPSVHTPA